MERHYCSIIVAGLRLKNCHYNYGFKIYRYKIQTHPVICGAIENHEVTVEKSIMYGYYCIIISFSLCPL